MNKISYQNIPKLVAPSNYHTTVDWRDLEHTLERWVDRDAKDLAKLDLDPPFQRLHVWTLDQQTKYVEYILRGGSSGKDIYFNCNGWQGHYKGPFVIVDGKQRIQAVREFLANRVPVFGGYYHCDIEGRLPADANFQFHVNNLPTMELVLKWYLEMNTGGTPHTQDELDKAKKLLDAEKNH